MHIQTLSLSDKKNSCSLNDLLWETKFVAQLFDWQNAVFLLFMPVYPLALVLFFSVTMPGE